MTRRCPNVARPTIEEISAMPTPPIALNRAAQEKGASNDEPHLVSIGLRASATATFAAVVATFVAGCNVPRVDDHVHPVLTDPARRHPVTMVAETATLDLPIGHLSKGNDARAYLETTKFMRNYGYEGRGPITIVVPRGASGRASPRIQAVRLAAYRAGIPSSRIRVLHGGPGGHGGELMTVSYDRIAAIGPTCGDWSADAGQNRDGIPYANFGCASQRNLAAMAANPTDLMFPARETERTSITRGQDTKNFNSNIGKTQQLGTPR